MSGSVYHVFTRAGDGVREVEAVLEALQARGVSREGAGLYKCMYVTRADQTVLMTESRDSALAVEMRGRPGWREPGDRKLA
ncbi:MAG TPA: hypothetical protein VHG08_08940 [Longimicrobium sp.]|nr:hypothetical protein [Longimicrobium sp.]